MAFLAHSIPWQTVSSKLEYQGSKSDNKPQHARIKFRDHANEVKHLEYFAQKFRATVREHSADERKKFNAPEDYSSRAKEWLISRDEQASPCFATDTRASGPTTYSKDALRKQRNQELRQMRNASTNGGWPTGPEHRMVYSEDFVEEYSRASDRPERQKQHTRILQSRTGQTIQEWIRLSMEELPQYRDEHLCEDYAYCDLVKLFVTDAATTTQPDHYQYTIETLMLLAHHPQVNLEGFTRQSMNCCNMFVGFDRIATLAVKVFVVLNILASMQDLGVKEMTRLQTTTVAFERNQEHRLDTIYHWTPMRWLGYIELLPRPGYMNLRSWKSMLKNIHCDHVNQAENVIFGKIFYPPGEDGMPVEIDILSDRSVLKSHLKTMWKVIIIVDIIMRELKRPINWEYVVLETLDECYGWPSDEYFYLYRDRRRGWGVPDEQKTQDLWDFQLYSAVE